MISVRQQLSADIMPPYVVGGRLARSADDVVAAVGSDDLSDENSFELYVSDENSITAG